MDKLKLYVFIILVIGSVLGEFSKVLSGVEKLDRELSCGIDGLMCHEKFESLLTKSNISLNDILVVTVASDKTDGLERYLRSAAQFGITPEVLGLGRPWLGGDITHYPGGGYKVNLLRTFLQQYKDDNRILIFTDSYDVIFLSNLEAILKQFNKMDARILFSAEATCWPKKDLSMKYPLVINGKPYLNSGMFMGYATDIYKLLTISDISDTDDDQLFYTNAYLDENLRNELHIKLDHQSEIFQNLYGAVAEVQITFDNKEPILENTVTKTVPLILHGNGFSKLVLNSLSNYLSNNWNSERGCIGCWENTINLDNVDKSEWPIVFIAMFIERPTPFLEEYFAKIADLAYPKERIHLFVHNAQEYHAPLVQEFIQNVENAYLSIKHLSPEAGVEEATARNLALDTCLDRKCEFYLNVDSEAQLDNKYTLKLLIEQNRTFVAPVLVRPGKAWSNFWGALSNGFYARSFDYMDIVHDNRRGLWNVPFVSTCYLLNSTLLHKYTRKELTYVKEGSDPDMVLCENLRKLNIFMYVSNRMEFGHLINPESYDVTRAAPEMYEMFDNRYDWEQRYLHENYSENFNPNNTVEQPCPDVYWFPVVTMRFCKDLIHMMETFGQWSDGKNSDPRLDSGYEAVPTRDIHMNQVGWERHWMLFLKDIVRPLQEMVFTGYYHDPPRALMNFVVRYRPDEQPSLRPHHDSSTFTINLALNTPGVDYEGGGCRFIRYNCSVTDTKPGWLLMHPGRLTHYHEGLKVTKGTRYIMISFVDP